MISVIQFEGTDYFGAIVRHRDGDQVHMLRHADRCPLRAVYVAIRRFRLGAARRAIPGFGLEPMEEDECQTT
jgi:hypothetical protein